MTKVTGTATAATECPPVPSTTAERVGVNYPKFADRFAKLDFTAVPMPVIALFPVPPVVEPEALELRVCGLDCKPRVIPHSAWRDLPKVQLAAPLICQIFNWSEEVVWEGVRLADFLDCIGLDTAPEGYFSIFSRDENYFEGFSRDEVRDPRMLLATSVNGQPLSSDYGGPLRLVAPFLQGYKSVKWVGAIRATQHDPIGIKRLLGQSKTGRLGRAWRERYDIQPPAGLPGDPD